MNTFDKNLKRLRIQRNLKQEELAEKLHVTRQTVSGWETGRRQPDLDMLKKLAEVLDIDMQELLYGVKPRAYPRFRKKHVICTAISGSIAAVLLLFRLLLLPYVKMICNTHHWDTVLPLPDPAFYPLFPEKELPPMVLHRRLYCVRTDRSLLARHSPLQQVDSHQDRQPIADPCSARHCRSSHHHRGFL